MYNQVEFKVSGKYALFTDPLTKIGGEKFSYPVPTYSALVGICEAIYWKPTFVWIVDDVRVMHRVERRSIGTRPISLYDSEKSIMSIYNYLMDVEYQVRAHIEWDYSQENLAHDRIDNKHWESAKRWIKKGGHRKVFLGTSECVAYVEPCTFGEGNGYYDNAGTSDLGIMLHGITYATKSDRTQYVRLWNYVMENGVIHFPRPEECTIVRPAGRGSWKEFPNKKEVVNELDE